MRRWCVLAVVAVVLAGEARGQEIDRARAFVEAHEELEGQQELARLLALGEEAKLAARLRADAGSKLKLDTVAGYVPRTRKVIAGLGLVAAERAGWRLTLQAASGALGAGLAYRVIPVVDLAVGVGAFWDPTDSVVDVGAFVTLARW